MKKYILGLCLLLAACKDAAVCDVTAVFQSNGCTSARCHGSGQAVSFDLSLTNPGPLLVDKLSQNPSCAGRKIIDKQSPDNSLLLTLTDASRHVAPNDCGAPMPFGGAPLSAKDLACLQDWVRDTAQNHPSVQPDYTAEFEPASVEAYVTKVKLLVHGGAVTQSELASVKADPNQLRSKVESWIGPAANPTPEFAAKLTAFLSTALQQDSVGEARAGLGFPGSHFQASPMLRSNLTDSFTLTALDLVKNNRPFTEILHTDTWTVSNALLVLLAFADQSETELQQTHTVYKAPTMGVTESLATRTWIFETIPDTCKFNPADNNLLDQSEFLRLMFRRQQCRGMTSDYYFTGADLTTAPNPSRILQDSDFVLDRKVQFVAPTGALPIPKFYDLQTIRTLRQSGKFPTRTTRAGFFTTPVFFDNWQTNMDNQFRVTTNQTLLVGLGATFSIGDSTAQPLLNGLPMTHFPADNSACFGCHRLMDPMRLYFGKAYNYAYRYPTTAEPLSPSFAFLGQTQAGSSPVDLGRAMAQHPRFPVAWVQKLCSYANSQPCDESDPEFLRLAKSFQDSGYKLRDLIVEFFTSPLVTNASFTKTFASRRVLLSINRRRHLCAALKARLSVDACSLAISKTQNPLSGIPDDAFARGATDAVIPATTSGFHAAAVEQLCAAIAAQPQIVPSPTFPNNDPPGAIKAMVEKVMGLPPSHSRYQAALTALSQHYAAQPAATMPTAALRETFTVACMTPDAMAIGF